VEAHPVKDMISLQIQRLGLLVLAKTSARGARVLFIFCKVSHCILL
jgi:hypothetical protein